MQLTCVCCLHWVTWQQRRWTGVDLVASGNGEPPIPLHFLLSEREKPKCGQTAGSRDFLGWKSELRKLLPLGKRKLREMLKNNNFELGIQEKKNGGLQVGKKVRSFCSNLLNQKHGFVCLGLKKKKENSDIFIRRVIHHPKGYVKGWECSGHCRITPFCCEQVHAKWTSIMEQIPRKTR